MLNLNPKLIKRSVKITGLTSGELNKNTLLTPSDTPLFKNPFKSGIVEHEQNGVIAPTKNALIKLEILVFIRCFLSFWLNFSDTINTKKETQKNSIEISVK